MNEITKFDEEGNITKEWSEYVKNLDREDLETFFIGADALINKAIEYIEENCSEHGNEESMWFYRTINADNVLNILKGVDKE